MHIHSRQITLVSIAFLICSPAHSDVLTIAAECDDCHGENGVSQHDDIPTIAGMSDFVLSEAMFVYLDGDRPCRESEFRHGDDSRPATTMCDIARDLSEDDIMSVSEHYAALPFVPAVQDFDAGKAEAGAGIHRDKCEKCHTDGGTNPDDDTGVLAGQWAPYLNQSMADYMDGSRVVLDDKMQEKLDELDAGMIDALVHYYASQQ